MIPRFSKLIPHKDEMIALRKQGETFIVIGKKFGVGYSTARVYLNKIMTSEDALLAFRASRARSRKNMKPYKHYRNRGPAIDVQYWPGNNIQCINLPETCPCNRCVKDRQSRPSEQQLPDNTYKAWGSGAAR